jgi:peptidylprolyl isomerase
VQASELTLTEVARRLAAGEEGSPVKLTMRQIRSESGPRVEDVTLTRSKLTVAARSSSSGYDGPAGGLYAGSGSGPKPPPALFLAVAGMREGGRRSVLVPPDVGYDDAGSNEIPPNEPFVMEVELISVKSETT